MELEIQRFLEINISLWVRKRGGYKEGEKNKEWMRERERERVREREMKGERKTERQRERKKEAVIDFSSTLTLLFELKN